MFNSSSVFKSLFNRFAVLLNLEGLQWGNIWAPIPSRIILGTKPETFRGTFSLTYSTLQCTQLLSPSWWLIRVCPKTTQNPLLGHHFTTFSILKCPCFGTGYILRRISSGGLLAFPGTFLRFRQRASRFPGSKRDNIGLTARDVKHE